MKFREIFRRRSKSRRRSGNDTAQSYNHLNYSPPLPTPRYDVTRDLPRPILTRIFTYVCPHVTDASYNTSEESMTEDGCMPCDMRDLSHCTTVCKRWYMEAQRLLYG